MSILFKYLNLIVIVYASTKNSNLKKNRIIRIDQIKLKELNPQLMYSIKINKKI